MSHTIDRTGRLFGSFNPISLAALNAKAAMLERLDNKYVVHQQAHLYLSVVVLVKIFKMFIIWINKFGEHQQVLSYR